MTLVNFLLSAMLISLSGALAPGPITAVTVGKGSRSPHAGALVALGHGVVEIPLAFLIFFGFGTIINIPAVKLVIGLVGGGFLIYMGRNMLRNIRENESGEGLYNYSSFYAGIILSITNPYFILWWATVGTTLAITAGQFGIHGFLLLMGVHWLCDFIWFYFLSALSFRGGSFLGLGFQKTVFAVCGLMLFFFGGKFIYDAIRLGVFLV